MKKLFLISIAALVASAAMAQSNTIALSALQPQFSGESATTDGERIPLGLRSRVGYEIEAAHRVGRTSFALSAGRMSAPANAPVQGGSVRIGSMSLTPMIAAVALHGGSSTRFDPYIGAGAAYVMTGNLRSANLDSLGIGTVSLGNDFTYAVNAGVGIAMSPGIGLKFDARYMPVSIGATAADGSSGHVEFKTITLAAGVQWKF